MHLRLSLGTAATWLAIYFGVIAFLTGLLAIGLAFWGIAYLNMKINKSVITHLKSISILPPKN